MKLLVLHAVCVITALASFVDGAPKSPLWLSLSTSSDPGLCVDGYYDTSVDCLSCGRTTKSSVVYRKCCEGDEAYVNFCQAYMS